MTKVIAKATSTLPHKIQPKQALAKETCCAFYHKPEDTSISAEEIGAEPERTGAILNFLTEINQTNPQITRTARAAQPVLSRSPLLQHADTLDYSTKDVVKSELTGDNIDLPYFCCIPCPIL